MSINLSQELQDSVRREVESGHFPDEQSLINEAIELLRARRNVLDKLQTGIAQLERGEGTEYGPEDRQQFFADVLGHST